MLYRVNFYHPKRHHRSYKVKARGWIQAVCRGWKKLQEHVRGNAGWVCRRVHRVEGK
jgi:hypothetical protein